MQNILLVDMTTHVDFCIVDDDCSNLCYAKFAFVAIDPTKSPNDTPYTISITKPFQMDDRRAYFHEGKIYPHIVETFVNRYENTKFSIYHTISTEACIDVEYKPLLVEIKNNIKYSQLLVSKLKSKYRIESYQKSFESLVNIITK